MTSMPLGMTCAESKSLNPSIGRVRCLIARWSPVRPRCSKLCLTNPDGRLALGIHRMKRGQIGTALVYGYCLGRAVLSHGLLKEAPPSSLSPLGSEHKIDRVAPLFRAPVMILP